jgi:hypothetical protein
MANGTTSNGMAIPTGLRTEITTTRTRDDIVTTLTNLDTKSDAWGKVIPMGFGRHRVAGALVWASQFYKTTESFDDTTTQQSIVSWLDHQDVYNSITGADEGVTNTPFDVVRSSGSQVTHGSTENAYIDLCYSFGTEGDVRKRRYIEKIRVNDTLIYDQSQSPPFIMDGIGFSVRYGYDNAAPDLMAKYPNGIFHYKDQTLLIFDKFPLSVFGNATPQSVDVEWGCCVGDAVSSSAPPDGGLIDCDAQFIYYGGFNSENENSWRLHATYWQPTVGNIAIASVVTYMRGDNSQRFIEAGWTSLQYNGIPYAYTSELFYRILSQADVDAIMAGTFALCPQNEAQHLQSDNQVFGFIFIMETHLPWAQSYAGSTQGEVADEPGYAPRIVNGPAVDLHFLHMTDYYKEPGKPNDPNARPHSTFYFGSESDNYWGISAFKITKVGLGESPQPDVPGGYTVSNTSDSFYNSIRLNFKPCE